MRAAAALLVSSVLFALTGCGGGASDGDADSPTSGADPVEPAVLTVYCAHDSIYAEEVLDRFEAVTGIQVRAKFDTEATKSLGLTELIIREADNPQCDVFWNNQMLGTVDLKERDLLVHYKGAGWDRIPAQYKDPDGAYVGFGARLRVWILNTEGEVPADHEAIDAVLEEEDIRHVAMARPMFGTTLSHYAVLWHHLGADSLKSWHHDLRKRRLTELAGNSHVMRAVAAGRCELGWTDTDDFFVAKDRGDSVEMLPIRVPGTEQVIAMPNTAAIIKGTKHLAAAQQLVDYLASAENEINLAMGKARQIPLGQVADDALPDEVRELRRHVPSGYPLAEAAKARLECLKWLKRGARG